MIRESARLPVLIVAGAVIVLVLFAAALFANLERIERTVRTPPTGAARDNPFLASERLLTHMGVRATSTSRLDELPPVDHVIVLAAETRVLTETRARRLLEWVSAGGYLIVGPHLKHGRVTDETSNDVLLEELGIAVEPYTRDPDRAPREVVELESANGEEPVPVEFFADFGLSLVDEPDEAGTYVAVWREYGDGFARVVTDLRFARSEEIGKFAHARFLWELVRGFEERDDVLLVYGTGAESLWRLVVRHAWLVLVLGSLLLLAWVWRSAVRFGPRIPAPEPRNRSLTEHVEALGHFLWRARRADILVDGERRVLERRILRRRPELAGTQRERLAHELAVHSGIDERTIESALFGGHPIRRDDFVATIRTLQQLQRAL